MNETKLNQGVLPDLCPVDGAVCDRKCGYGAHATIKRANPLKVNLPEDPADANICEGCE